METLYTKTDTTAGEQYGDSKQRTFERNGQLMPDEVAARSLLGRRAAGHTEKRPTIRRFR